jgi:hypothetical protein
LNEHRYAAPAFESWQAELARWKSCDGKATAASRNAKRIRLWASLEMQPSLARLEGWTIACEPSLHAAETSLRAAFRVKVPIQFSNSLGNDVPLIRDTTSSSRRDAPEALIENMRCKLGNLQLSADYNPTTKILLWKR